MRRALPLLLTLLGCQKAPVAIPGTQVQMSFDRAGGLYSAPVPSDDLRGTDGLIALKGFPNPGRVDLVTHALALVAEARGFALTGGVFFSLSAAPAALPDLAGSVADTAPIFLLAVEKDRRGYLRRVPLQIGFAADGGPFGAKNLLSLLPLQGTPLRPGTLYAAVVLRALGDAQGKPLGVPLALAQLAASQTPPALPAQVAARYLTALAALREDGIASDQIAGLAVFTTDTPAAQLATFQADARTHPPLLLQPFVAGEVFADFCVFTATVGMPDYQAGTPPFASAGGGWMTDASGKPILQRTEAAHLVVTVPRTPMPAAGFPTAVFVRTGGGGDRPLVDRGVQPGEGKPATIPGTGPALQFARAGYLGVQVDGPLGGLRNTTHGDEQFLIFNVLNPQALRDNVRQSALELTLLPDLLPTLALDASSCSPGASPLRFDLSHLALMGHSMGATIAPLALAQEPRYGAAVLSGAGGSWIENILYKQQPVAVRPLAELLLGYQPGTLLARDPVLTLVQWAAEAADPQVYARSLIEEPAAGAHPRHVLMEQGIVDHYILPDIANTLSLSLGLDLAGTPLDSGPADLVGQTQLTDLLPYSQRAQITLPAQGNHAGTTAVVIQQPSDGIEDGHEVVFQTEAPKHQYRCFLQSWLTGIPRVPAGGAADAACE